MRDRQLGWTSCCRRTALSSRSSGIRDKAHAARVGDELIVDIEHYHRHPDCARLWCAVYDPRMLIRNPAGVVSDLEHSRSTLDGLFSVRVLVVPGAA